MRALYEIFRKDNVLKFLLAKNCRNVGFAVWSIIKEEKFGEYRLKVDGKIVLDAIKRFLFEDGLSKQVFQNFRRVDCSMLGVLEEDPDEFLAGSESEISPKAAGAEGRPGGLGFSKIQKRKKIQQRQFLEKNENSPGKKGPEAAKAVGFDFIGDFLVRFDEPRGTVNEKSENLDLDAPKGAGRIADFGALKIAIVESLTNCELMAMLNKVKKGRILTKLDDHAR